MAVCKYDAALGFYNATVTYTAKENKEKNEKFRENVPRQKT